MKIGRIAGFPLAVERDAAGNAVRVSGAKRAQLFGEQRLEPARAGREEALRKA